VNKKYLETIKALDGELYHLDYHQERLNKTLGCVGIHKLQNLLHPPKNGLYRCRVVYDNISFAVEYLPYLKRQLKSLRLVYNDSICYKKKYENRVEIDELYKQRDACDDILIVKNGLLSDTSIANIALYDGQVWHTPRFPLLHGITRGRFLDTKKIQEKDIRVEDIYSYKKVALMNAMIDFDIIAEENIREKIC